MALTERNVYAVSSIRKTYALRFPGINRKVAANRTLAVGF